MTTFAIAFKDQVRKLARKEIRGGTGVLRRSSAQFRRDIAALKRAIAALTREIRRAGAGGAAAAATGDSEGMSEGARFSARSVRAQRKRLGISAADFGKLIGVSALTVYHWEGGKARPRAKQLAKFVAIRGIGKREAMEKITEAGGTPGGKKRGRKPKKK
jgi:DNA-binding transcriptional regulator YiaG